jgi:hypothetical protein
VFATPGDRSSKTVVVDVGEILDAGLPKQPALHETLKRTDIDVCAPGQISNRPSTEFMPSFVKKTEYAPG